MNRCVSACAASGSRSRSLNCRTCSSMRRRDPHAAAVLRQQVMEVNRPFLRAGELLRQHREHRPADDRRLDHRAGVDADHRRRVIDRIEEVGAVVRIDRVVAARAERTRHPAGPASGSGSHAWQLYGCGRTRTLMSRSVGSPLARSAAIHRRTNATSALRLRNEAGRAGEQQERPRVGQADARAERRAVARRPASRTTCRTAARRSPRSCRAGM